MLKKIVIPIVALTLFAGCKKNETTVGTKVDSSQEISENKFQGVYKGTLPCADCAGIETSLTLVDHNKAIYKTSYIDHLDGTSTIMGTYQIEGDILTLKLPNETLYFSVTDKHLKWLNQDKKPVEGELAPFYILNKVDTSKFNYEGEYAINSSKEKGAYWQKLSIKKEVKGYLVSFTASEVNGKEACRFSDYGTIKSDTLFVDMKSGGKTIPMAIAPTHDQLGVEVFTKNFENRFQLMYYCSGGGSLAGNYLKTTIAANQFSIFNANTTIAEVLQTIPFAQIEKTEGQGEFADDTYDDYTILNQYGQPLFMVTPKEKGDTNQKINRVKVVSPIFKTVKGISTQSTFGDIQKAYAISSIVPTEEHIVISVKELGADFSIHKKHLMKGWWNEHTKTIDPNKIPNNAPIDEFILWWNL
ncbi:copper resistance protein NlpE [Riemerella columbina]|uniref:copper resistance protein NlpE n=1 Tax=Riemerella columbina TaxID=103810 RepID=UPI000368468A|nr:copper resistance protein NlpE [Riemerella columbina]